MIHIGIIYSAFDKDPRYRPRMIHHAGRPTTSRRYASAPRTTIPFPAMLAPSDLRNRSTSTATALPSTISAHAHITSIPHPATASSAPGLQISAFSIVRAPRTTTTAEQAELETWSRTLLQRMARRTGRFRWRWGWGRCPGRSGMASAGVDGFCWVV